jgi:hypothetical protein
VSTFTEHTDLVKKLDSMHEGNDHAMVQDIKSLMTGGMTMLTSSIGETSSEVLDWSNMDFAVCILRAFLVSFSIFGLFWVFFSFLDDERRQRNGQDQTAKGLEIAETQPNGDVFVSFRNFLISNFHQNEGSPTQHYQSVRSTEEISETATLGESFVSDIQPLLGPSN